MAYSDEFNYSKDIIPFRYIPPRNPERNRDIQNLFTINDCFDVNYTDEYGQSHLHVACKFGTEKIVKDFLDHGAYPNDVEIRMEYNPRITGTTDNPSYDCVLAEMIFLLCHKKYRPVQVNARDKEGNTPLHLALKTGNKMMVPLLLKNGADPSLADADGVLPKDIMRDEDLAKIFLEKCAVEPSSS
ncbi:hypothetical protein TKK_0010663 [Trichogramma kaykai]